MGKAIMAHNYTYTITMVDIKNGNIQVKYTPENNKLASELYNLSLYVRKYDDSKFTIDEAIKFYAPHDKWDTQLELIENYDQLLNKTEAVITE